MEKKKKCNASLRKTRNAVETHDESKIGKLGFSPNIEFFISHQPLKYLHFGQMQLASLLTRLAILLRITN